VTKQADDVAFLAVFPDVVVEVVAEVVVTVTRESE
jgi:hypothetical protein